MIQHGHGYLGRWYVHYHRNRVFLAVTECSVELIFTLEKSIISLHYYSYIHNEHSTEPIELPPPNPTRTLI
jgi:hypothetical protein